MSMKSVHRALASVMIVAFFAMMTIGPASATAPTVSTVAATGVAYNSATLNGNLTAMGAGNTKVKVGFHWGTSSVLTGATNVTSGTKTTTGTFSLVLSNLKSVTTYYFRAWARNFTGDVDRPAFAQGSILSFTTPKDPTTIALQQATSLVTALLLSILPLFILISVFAVLIGMFTGKSGIFSRIGKSGGPK